MKTTSRYVRARAIYDKFNIEYDTNAALEHIEFTDSASNDLIDYAENAPEGTYYVDIENNEIYYKIRDDNDDCQVFYFLNDDIKGI